MALTSTQENLLMALVFTGGVAVAAQLTLFREDPAATTWLLLLIVVVGALFHAVKALS